MSTPASDGPLAFHPDDPTFNRANALYLAYASDIAYHRAPTALDVNRKFAPQFDATILKGVGHYPMLEDPARFNQALADVLKKLPAKK